MVIKMKIILWVLILGLTSGAFQGGDICSSQCATYDCLGTSSNQCNGVCYSGWSWNAVDGFCEFDAAAQKKVVDTSYDDGGDLYPVPDPGTFACDFSTMGSGVNVGLTYFGAYTANQVVQLRLDTGIYVAHYQIDLYFNIILQDTDSGGSTDWKNNANMKVNLTNTNNVKSKSMQTGGGGGSTSSNQNSGNNIVTTDKPCGDSGKRQNFMRMIYTSWTHNVTATPILFTLTTDNSEANAIWYAREFVLVARTCNQYCLTCFNKEITKCYTCDVLQGYMLSGTTCHTSCLPGYGPTADPGVCVLCDVVCTACYQSADNCSACTTSNPNQAFLYYNSTIGYSQCIDPCPDGYFKNTSVHACDMCHPNCTTCANTADNCYSCAVDFGWNSYTCYLPCVTSYFYQVIGNDSNCTSCPNVCDVCTSSTVCTVCTPSGNNTAYLLNVTCYRNCPDGYYNDDNLGAGPNLCLPCHASCARCTSNPSPCQYCSLGYYLLNSVCGPTCPITTGYGYIAFNATRQCLLCQIWCVQLAITFSFSDSMNNILYIDMTFTRNLDFITFPYQSFQTLSISNHKLSNYNVNYQITSTNSYRIIIEPKGYTFLYNQTVTVTTMDPPTPYHNSADLMPFKDTVYMTSAFTNWYLMRSPSMTDTESSVINGLNGLNNAFLDATSAPFIAQAKKSGVFSLLFGGAQITSTAILINTVPPQNMYEGVRFWGASVFFDVPQWERTSERPNNVFGNELAELTKGQRRLFEIQSLYWRFQRTGMTTFFIYDVYIPLLLILIAWILVLVGWLLKRYKGYSFQKHQPKFYTILHKLHEFIILYVTIATMLEWIYFNAASIQRWISLGICLAFTLYFVGYHLYIYYDMINYPQAIIGNEKFEYYVTRYSTFLKNIRYQEYEMSSNWTPKHWFRPYNYHLLSYYKKFCMLVALPIFYDSKHWQISVLLLLQLLQIARFVATKPYLALWRNIYRFVLELALFLFFMTIFILQFIMQEIIKNDQATLESHIKTYYQLGWFGFVMVWLFNLGFVLLLVIDIVQGCRQNNRQMMEEARRVYYYDKIVDFQKEQDQVPLALMNKWVKLGNLNDRNQVDLPQINIRVQYYKLIKHGGYYDVDILKTVELFMNTDLNFHTQNNTTPGKQIKKRIKLSKDVSKSLFNLVNKLYKTYAKRNTQALVIKTFARIEQSEFKAGDRVPLLLDSMLQKIEIESTSGEKESIVLKSILEGFPINSFELQSI